MSTPEDPFAAPDPNQAPPGQPQVPPPGQQYPPPGQQQPAYGQAPPPPPPPGYGQAPPPAGYPSAPQYGYAQPPAQTESNGLAIASIVCSAAGLITCGISSIVGVILGFVARGQIRKTGQEGRGLALAGIWVGAVVTVLYVVLFAVLLAVGIWAVDKSEDCARGEYGPPFSQQWFNAGCQDFLAD